MQIHKNVRTSNEGAAYMLWVTDEELATITNSLEDSAMRCAEGSDTQLKIDDLILTITKITGY